MDNSYIKNEVESNYLLDIYKIKNFRNSYKLESDKGVYGIKIVKYTFSHFHFILSAINHLNKKGFKKIPKILNTKDDFEYIKVGGNYAFLNEWIPSRRADYKDMDDLSKAARKLGELHKHSEGFNINSKMKPRIAWHSWIKVFETRLLEILDFKKRIYQKYYKSNFDIIYLSEIDEEIERGKKAIEELKKYNYYRIMDKEVLKRGFCHHDYAHHNVLIDENGEVNVIDFDYCILDTHIHDVGSLLIRSMKEGNWKNEVANNILNSYSQTNDVTEEEMKLIIAFIRFPQTFWQIGLQCYWEQQPWGEEFLTRRLNKYLDDRKQRENFLDNFL